MSGIVKRHAHHQDELNRRQAAAMRVIDDSEAIRRHQHRRRWRAVGGAVAWAIGVTLLLGSLGWLAWAIATHQPDTPPPPANERQGEHVTIDQLAADSGLSDRGGQLPAEPGGLWCGTSQWKWIGGWGSTIDCRRFGTGYREGGTPPRGLRPVGPPNKPPLLSRSLPMCRASIPVCKA